MAYGGSDGILETGEICFTRPVRYKRRKYTTADLLRVYRYVVESEGLEVPTCALLSALGVVDAARQNLDALRDIPCVGSGIEKLLPSDARELILEETGVDVLSIPLACQPNTINIASRYGGLILALALFAYLLIRIKRNPITLFVIKRVFLFSAVVTAIAAIAEVISLITSMILWGRASQEIMEVLACQADEDGNLKKFSEEFEIDQKLYDALNNWENK